MAQAGCFVPAASARLRVVDRVFTRVGASDDIAGGQSTFMREMAELTDILHAATAESLVLLDEVGRGTATTDGLAIAQATTEFIHDEVGASTLFATHYHELTDLEADHEGVFTLHFTADRDEEGVTFLHRVAEGPSSSSYGVEVARLAGVPDRVVERADDLVDAAEREAARRTAADESAESGRDSRDEHAATGRGGAHDRDAPAVADTGRPSRPGVTNGAPDPAEKTFSEPRERGGGRAKSAPLPDADSARGARDDQNHVVREVLAEIRGLDVARTTPMDALALLHELQRRLDDANQET
jgi:DNA mismatch repair protein MutS